MRETAMLQWNRDGQSAVRNLDFYRDVEEQLLAKLHPYGGGGSHLLPRSTER